MKKYLSYILTFLAGAGILVLAFLQRKNIEKVLKDNDKVKEELGKKDEAIASNNASLDQEEQKRQQAATEAEKLKNEKVDPNNIVDFFNQRK